MLWRAVIMMVVVGVDEEGVVGVGMMIERRRIFILDSLLNLPVGGKFS